MTLISTRRPSAALPAPVSRRAAAYSSSAVTIGTVGAALSADGMFFFIPAALLAFSASSTMQVQSYCALRHSRAIAPIAACAAVTLLSALTIGTAILSAPVTCSALAVATAAAGLLFVLRFPAAAPSA